MITLTAAFAAAVSCVQAGASRGAPPARVARWRARSSAPVPARGSTRERLGIAAITAVHRSRQEGAPARSRLARGACRPYRSASTRGGAFVIRVSCDLGSPSTTLPIGMLRRDGTARGKRDGDAQVRPGRRHEQPGTLRQRPAGRTGPVHSEATHGAHRRPYELRAPVLRSPTVREACRRVAIVVGATALIGGVVALALMRGSVWALISWVGSSAATFAVCTARAHRHALEGEEEEGRLIQRDGARRSRPE